MHTIIAVIEHDQVHISTYWQTCLRPGWLAVLERHGSLRAAEVFAPAVAGGLGRIAACLRCCSSTLYQVH
jgi:hypothetical protein